MLRLWREEGGWLWGINHYCWACMRYSVFGCPHSFGHYSLPMASQYRRADVPEPGRCPAIHWLKTKQNLAL